ncbi:phage holin [Anaerovorax odorimutans]|uniref:Phage holin n=1 Tax=Anaerovorax odorimutans TaxID=109327 RepID=A0ABT1RP96_9FIRM|nr:phage holin [Anaerovorax odorimutans]MCQ4637012.1 phage holin [Anaerovorax odorimutans]
MLNDKEILNFEDLDEIEEVDATVGLETGVSGQTIARTIVTFLALLNAVLAITGKTPLDLDENTIYLICTGIASVATTIWSWWKNNSFTRRARTADLVKDGVKEAV